MAMAARLLLLNFMWCVAGGLGLNSFLKILPDDYDSTKEPRPSGGEPIVVGVSWAIKGVYEINFREMTVLMSMYFRMSWSEPRLVRQDGEEEAIVPLDSSFMEQLWVPDLFIHEARDISSFRMIQEIRGIFLHPPNTILFSTLLQTRLACPMFFAKYPFDVQECPITVSSYRFGEEIIRLEWLPLGVSVHPSINHQLPNYDFNVEWNNITTKSWCTNCSFTPVSIGQARIILARRYTLHVLTVYVPSALFVAVAWVSFFWPPEVIPGRTVLIITSLLTVISMYAAIGHKSPETSYLKAVDVWLFICIVLVVLTLFQYAIIITLKKRQKERTKGEVFPLKNSYPGHTVSGGLGPVRQNSADSPRTSPSTAVGEPAVNYKAEGSQAAHRLILLELWTERAGKVGIPVIFLICNIVYWSNYLS